MDQISQWTWTSMVNLMQIGLATQTLHAPPPVTYSSVTRLPSPGPVNASPWLPCSALSPSTLDLASLGNISNGSGPFLMKSDSPSLAWPNSIVTIKQPSSFAKIPNSGPGQNTFNASITTSGMTLWQKERQWYAMYPQMIWSQTF